MHDKFSSMLNTSTKLGHCFHVGPMSSEAKILSCTETGTLEISSVTQEVVSKYARAGEQSPITKPDFSLEVRKWWERVSGNSWKVISIGSQEKAFNASSFKISSKGRNRHTFLVFPMYTPLISDWIYRRVTFIPRQPEQNGVMQRAKDCIGPGSTI